MPYLAAVESPCTQESIDLISPQDARGLCTAFLQAHGVSVPAAT